MWDSELRNHTGIDYICVLAHMFRLPEINSLCTIMLKHLRDAHMIHDCWVLHEVKQQST